MKKHLIALMKIALFVLVVILLAYFTGNMHILSSWYDKMLDHIRYGISAVQVAIAHL